MKKDRTSAGGSKVVSKVVSRKNATLLKGSQEEISKEGQYCHVRG